MSSEKNENTLKTYLRLLKYLKGLIGAFSLSIVGFLLFAVSQPMLAKVMELIIEAIESKNADARWTLPALAVGVFLLRGVGIFLGTYFNEYGWWFVFIAGLTPFPYKVITIASGVAGLSLPIFIVASLVSRGLRFFVVAGLLYFFGPPIKHFIEQRLGLMFTIFVALLVGGFVVLR